MNAHHQRAVKVIVLSGLLDAALGAAYAQAMRIGTWNGLYYAMGIATTSGNSPDVPHGWLPHAITVLMMATVIPLFISSFSFFTSGLADVSGAEERIKRHVNGALRHHMTKGAAVADPPK